MIYFLIIILLLAVLLLALFRYKDKMYFNKKTKEVLSDRVKESIELDKQDFVRRQTKFEGFLKKQNESK